MTTTLTLAAVLALAGPPTAPPGAPPRVVLTLSVKHGQSPQLTVENAAPQAATLAGESYLVLTAATGAGERSYWGRLETEATPGKHGSVALAPRGKVTVAVRPGDLEWAPDRTGLGPDHPLGRVVPPGEYRLSVQVQAPEGGWWRSNELPVEVGPAGSLRYR